MKHTSADALRLRQSNPIPNETFGDVASDSLGKAAFEAIVASAATPPPATPPPAPEPRGRVRATSAASGSARSGKRLAVRIAAPATAAVAMAATAVAVALWGVGGPAQPSYALDAFLTVRPAAHGSGSAAAVLRQLAERAAAQGTQALGPVEFSSNRSWENIGDNIPRNLNYLSHDSYSNQAWDAVSGASAVHIVRNSDGKVFTSTYPADKWTAQDGAWIDPATLPARPSALRQRLLNEPGAGANKTYYYATYVLAVRRNPHYHGRRILVPQEVMTGESNSRSAALNEVRQAEKAAPGAITKVHIHKIGAFGFLSWQTVFVSNAIRFMTGEPLSPAVHSAMLQVLAQIATHPGHGYAYVNMGTATDRLGRTGVVIGQEEGNDAGPHYVGVQSLVFDPRTGALLDVANAQCEIALGAIPMVTGQCVPTDYTEYNLPRAVPAVPRYQAHIPGLDLQAGGPYV